MEFLDQYFFLGGGEEEIQTNNLHLMLIFPLKFHLLPKFFFLRKIITQKLWSRIMVLLKRINILYPIFYVPLYTPNFFFFFFWD